MIRRILNLIESKKSSDFFVWKFLYSIKFSLFTILYKINRLSLRLILGKKIRVISVNNLRFRILNFYNIFYNVYFSRYCFPREYIIKIIKDKIIIIIIPRLSPVLGEFNAVGLYFKEYLPDKGDVVIDGGAYNGLFTIVLSFLVGKTGKVISFEPDSINFEKLKNNTKEYNLKNVVLINKGLFSDNLRLPFNTEGNMCSRISTSVGDRPSDVLFVTVDSELERLGMKKVNYIKMDVEGAEVEAVKGCKKTLARDNIHLAIASYHKIKGRESYHQLEKILRTLGYSAKTYNSFHTITYAHRKQKG